MESSFHGEVRFNHIHCSHKVRNFARKYLETWIIQHGLSSASTFYRVVFTRNGRGHTVECEVEVKSDKQRWTGFTISDDLHQSLVRCLESTSRSIAVT